jgi:hypothetical protein
MKPRIALTVIVVLAIAAPLAVASGDETYVKRENLGGKIFHYTYSIDVGDGPYDTILVHRVVRERGNGQPLISPHAVMLAHGDALGFEASFLTPADPSGPPIARDLATYLARRGIDVWGIDFRWALVPPRDDYGFMADWGLQQDVDDLSTALDFALGKRERGETSMHLLGWSRGGLVGYALLDQESQMPCGERLVKGFIPVDILIEADPDDPLAQEAVRPVWCAIEEAYEDQVADGIYADSTGQLLALAASLARLDPDGPSPLPDLVGLFEGYTNREFALALGAQTYELSPVAPDYHLAAGETGPDGRPNRLLFTAEDTWLTFLESASPVQPTVQIEESTSMVCDDPADPSPFDDHLAQVTVPALYVGAGGGIGRFGEYSLTLLGSDDTRSLLVDLEPSTDNRVEDYGHADLFKATNARTLVWPTIQEWIKERPHVGCE